MADDFTTSDDYDVIDDPDLKRRHKDAISAFKLSASYFAEQRKREMEDLKFIDFDDQWDTSAKTMRAGGQTVSGQPPAPARPAITINQLRGPCQQVAAQRRSARLSLSFAPKGPGTDQDTAEAFEDIVRAIQAESRAAVARNWAADRAEKAGMGWYRIDTEYAVEKPTDNAAWNDQEITYRRILNQASVYPDPFAQEPDFSDGKRLYLTQDLPWDAYQREYPESKLAAMENAELSAIGDKAPNFVFDGDVDGEQGKTVRIAECWEVAETEREYVLLIDGKSAFTDDVEADQIDRGPQGKSRMVRDRKVVWSKLNAIEYLDEPRDWNGAYIPIIPVIGEESNIDGERRWTGLVRPGKEAARSYNTMRSAQIEAIAMASKSPYIGYFETIEPFLDWWKNANLRNFPMLPVKAARGPDGTLLPPPQRNVAEPAIQAITMAAQAAKEDIHTTTGVPPVALGQLDPHDRSGKAIQALQAQAETGASHYLDNLVNISMAYEGKVLRDLIPRIYDRPGRIIPAIGIDEQRRMVMVNQPYVEGPGGQVQAVPNWQPGMPIPEGAVYLDLSAAEMSMQPTVSKEFATQREATRNFMLEAMKMMPPEMQMAILPAVLEEFDQPGARKLADISKKALPPQLAKIYTEDDNQPEAQLQAAQQKLEQMGQLFEVMTKELQAKTQIIETDKVKAEQQLALQHQKSKSDIEMERMTADKDIYLAKMKIVADLLKTQATLDANKAEREIDAAVSELDRQVAQAGQRQEIESTSIEASRDREHQMSEAERARQFQGQEAEAQRQQEQDMQASQQAQEQQMAQQQQQQKPQGQ